jgi:hypothetical protein
VLKVEWLDRFSVRVSLDVRSQYDDPEVTLRMFEMDKETPIAFQEGSGEGPWPIVMEQESGRDRWSVVVPKGALVLDVGQKVWIEVQFDNGPDNFGTFTGEASVRHG